MKILFYISGHGFGHATRMAAIMGQLAEIMPEVHIYIRAMVGRNLFDFLPDGCLTYNPTRCDVGVVERDLFSQDIDETLRQNQTFYRTMDEFASREAEYVRESGVSVIVSDIPPSASLIGYRSGVPVIGVTNFTWDFIFQDYVRLNPGFLPLVELFRKTYAHTRLLLRLPFHHEMSEFSHVEDIPLVVRPCLSDRNTTLRRLKLDPQDRRRKVLVALRMKNVLPPETLSRLFNDLSTVYILTESTFLGERDNVRVLSQDWRPWEFPDILRSCDAVISKLGYGIASECIAYHIPLLYIPRFDFAEFQYLREGIEGFVPASCMTESEFASGIWDGKITDLLDHSPVQTLVKINGANIAAKRILAAC